MAAEANQSEGLQYGEFFMLDARRDVKLHQVTSTPLETEKFHF